MRSPALLLASVACSTAAAETVLGVYIFHRHGDRTAKTLPPSVLTDLGYEEVFTSGTYYRNRYIASDCSSPIFGVEPDVVKLSQITASAPLDNVLMPSAMGFLQGLYPPVGATLSSQTLRNGTVVKAPLNGSQLIPVQTVANGAGSENTAWLQGSTNCANAQISSNNYFQSSQYLATLEHTKGFYADIYPFVSKTFTATQTSFQSAYTVFDLLNVASIHNASGALPDAADFFQLRTLADQHEWGLAFNESEPIRAVTGAILAAQVMQALNGTIAGKGKNLFNVQFGAYAGMMSYFGLANLTLVSPNFYGVADYASSLVWELVTNATVGSGAIYPSADDVSVRFYFHNGTASPSSQLVEFPLFGTARSPLPWSEFVAASNKFAIGSQAQWCNACGNSTGVCSPSALDTNTSDGAGGSSSASSLDHHGSGISKAVAGVIGAMVALGVILAAELLIMLIGGLRLVSKRRLARTGENGAHLVGEGGAAKA